jgi:murein DD-endopeptidase MepM/ murein hydrolase activator NlpD
MSLNKFYKIEVIQSTDNKTIKSFRLPVIAIFIIGAILVALIVGLIIMYSSVSKSMDLNLRRQYTETAIKLDSISTQSRINNNYLENIRKIITGDISQSKQDADASKIGDEISTDSLISATEAERQFINKFEENTQFNLSVLSPIAADGMYFYAPTEGIEATPASADRPNGVILYALATTPVSAIYRGSIILVQSGAKGNTVVIQHPNEFISIYSGLSEIFVSNGDKINTGTRIGIAEAGKFELKFELWHNGTALDPRQYINF